MTNNKVKNVSNVSKVTARLLGYRTPADVPFQVKANGWPVARKGTAK